MHTRPGNARTDSDLELLRRVAAEDRDALSELFRIYQPRLFKFIYRMTSSYTTTDELVCDVMFTVWQKAATFRGESRVSTWILGIAYRRTLRHLSRHRPLPPSSADTERLADEAGVDIERENWVRLGIDSLSDVQRITVMLVFYLGLSYEEVSEVSGCPVNTVKTRMFHARRNLKKQLRELERPAATGKEAGND